MKNKKILTAIFSVATAATLCVTAIAGCKKEKHDYNWTVVTEETCSSDGQRRGVCIICGDVKEEAIPADPAKHAYGEWEITMPTVSAEGKAKKVCAHNAGHTEEVDLPALTEAGTGYLSHDVTKEPTVLEEGVRTYVFETANGNVNVNVSLPKKEATTVADAVLLGSSLGNTVRSASGYYTDTENSNRQEHAFSVEFGDNYTHITDEGQREQYWYSLDENGVPFGIYTRTESVNNGDSSDNNLNLIDKQTDPRAVEDATESNLLGYGYSAGTNQIRGYGAEDLLRKYYSAATTAQANGKAALFEEHFTKDNSTKEISAGFSYGYYENPNFARYTIEFTLYSSGAIKNLRMDTKLIRAYMIEEDAEGNKLFYDNNDIVYAEEYDSGNNNEPLYEYEADGKTVVISGVKTDAAGNILHDSKGNEIPRYKPLNRDNRKYYSDSHAEVNNRTIVYTEQVLKTDSDQVPANPYSSDVLYINSFDVKYRNATVSSEEPLSLPTDTVIYFEIDNIQPTTASLNYDPLKVFVKSPSREYELDNRYDSNEYKMIGGFLRKSDNVSHSNQVYINSHYATDEESATVELIIRTSGGRFEKHINLLFERSAPPTEMTVQAYTYSGGWQEYSQDNTLQIYTGQSVYVRAVASDEEAGYVDTSFTATAYPAKDLTIENGVDFDNQTVSKITATNKGNYNVALTYEKASISERFTLSVIDPPSLGDVLKGDYETRATLTLGTNTGVANTLVKVRFTYTTNYHQGTIDVEAAGYTAQFRYEVGENNEITVTPVGELPNDTFNFIFTVNEEYEIEIFHNTGIFGENESVVLSRPLAT